MAATIELPTALQNDKDGDITDTLNEFSAFVHENYHEDFMYRILGVRDTPITFNRDKYVAFFASEAEGLVEVDRMGGIAMFVSYEFNEETKTETVIVQNRAWANLVFADNPDTKLGNFARLEWTFTREQNGEWKLFLWDDYPKLFPL